LIADNTDENGYINPTRHSDPALAGEESKGGCASAWILRDAQDDTLVKAKVKVPTAHAARTVQRCVEGKVAAEERDDLAVEEPLEIRVEGRAVAVTMRTPGHDEELAAGFLLTEGVVARREDIVSITPALAKKGGGMEPNIVDVRLARPEAVDFARLTRHVFTASSCGLCGKATIAAVQARNPPLDPEAGPRVAAEGKLLVSREDVGRHNAVDKVLGHLLLNGRVDPVRLVLLVSGRVAFEIVQKALAARIAFIAAISAPTSLAVDFARANGQTLVGFLRDGRMNIYAGADRIIE
jgi:FdhD protein